MISNLFQCTSSNRSSRFSEFSEDVGVVDHAVSAGVGSVRLPSKAGGIQILGVAEETPDELSQ